VSDDDYGSGDDNSDGDAESMQFDDSSGDANITVIGGDGANVQR